MLSLEEAIKHAEETAKEQEERAKGKILEKECLECAAEHRQLAEWLKDYKKAKCMANILAKVLDGCQLTNPCNKLWKPEGWCQENCRDGQDAPNKKCWIKYAEVIANE